MAYNKVGHFFKLMRKLHKVLKTNKAVTICGRHTVKGQFEENPNYLYMDTCNDCNREFLKDPYKYQNECICCWLEELRDK